MTANTTESKPDSMLKYTTLSITHSCQKIEPKSNKSTKTNYQITENREMLNNTME